MLIYGKEVPLKIVERFWSRIAVKSDDVCWEWQAGLNSKKPMFNYGIFWINGKKMLAHRVSLSLYRGVQIPSDLDVIHSCDNPLCCNPHHLKTGTHADNMRDKANKGRAPAQRGTLHKLAKLNDDKVREIKKLYAMQEKYKHYTFTNLARMYNVSRYLISKVVAGKAWAHIKD